MASEHHTGSHEWGFKLDAQRRQFGLCSSFTNGYQTTMINPFLVAFSLQTAQWPTNFLKRILGTVYGTPHLAEFTPNAACGRLIDEFAQCKACFVPLQTPGEPVSAMYQLPLRESGWTPFSSWSRTWVLLHRHR